MGHLHRLRRAEALLIAAGCAALFVAVYGACTALTASRLEVGTLAFEWERHIPFVPLMIIPYWSIDLLFILSFFICTGRAEVRALGGRIALAILLAGFCFLVMPLELVFPRPPVGGFLGALFGILRGFDQPFNLCPSLHIALRTILVATYAAHTRGAARASVHLWFSLIGISTLLTWQHQVIDVVGGFLLAAVCFYAIDASERRAATTNRVVGARYLLGAFALAIAGFFWWPMLWPATSLALVSAGYFGLGASVYRDLHWSARLLLAPVLVAQWLSLLWYRRRSTPWSVVDPRVWIGRKLTDAEAADAVRLGVTAVLDMTCEFREAAPFRALCYRRIPVLDLTAPTPDQLAEAADFIREESSRGLVYVHCKAGYSRSAAAVAAWMVSEGIGADEALSGIRKARPGVVIRPEVERAIAQFALPRS